MGFSIQNQGYTGAEAGFSGRVGSFHAGDFLEEFIHVGVEIAAFPGIAGGVDSGSASKDIYLESRIVGKAVTAGFPVEVFRLLEGVFPQRGSGFRHNFRHSGFRRTDYLKAGSEDFPRLPDFSWVRACENYFSHTAEGFFRASWSCLS